MEWDKKRLLARFEALKTERSSWLDHWRELSQHIRPRSAKFGNELPNSGLKKHGSIINAKPTLSARTLAAGMMAGITSPSRPWFQLTTYDPQLADREGVKNWLMSTERKLRELIARTNLYRCLHSIYSDLAVYGVSPAFVEADAEELVRGYVLPIGSFALATSDRGEVDTLFRALKLSVRQVVSKFGLAACSQSLQDRYNRGALDEWVDVLHCVWPNTDMQPGKIGVAGKAYVSAWLEPTNDETFLRLSGYDEKPFLAPRWETSGEDVYGMSPAMDCLGDCKALQKLELRKAQLVDKLSDPPMRAPTSLQNRRVSLLPGDVTFVDGATAGHTYEPAYQVPPQAVAVVASEILQHERRIESAFYADLWLMLSQADGQMTAREVMERREEKLLQLGTVLENLHGELLSPLIERCLAEAARRGKLDPPPVELRAGGDVLKVEYVSIMAQAQKLLGKTGIDSLITFVGASAQLKPDVLDKVDLDQTVDEYASMLGVPPSIIRPDDAVAALRKQREAAAAQQQQLEQAQAGADAAKTLAQAPLDNPNALTEMLRGVGVR